MRSSQQPIALALLAALAAGGCHLIYPFDVLDAGTGGSDTVEPDAAPDAAPDGPSIESGPARDHRLDLPPHPDQQLPGDASVTTGKVTTFAGVPAATSCSSGPQGRSDRPPIRR